MANKEEFQLTTQEKGHYVIEAYGIFTPTLCNISNRRALTNNYFIAINSILASALAILLRVAENEDMCESLWRILSIIFFCIAAGYVCICWSGILKAYEQIILAKLKVLQEMEVELPMKPVTREMKLRAEETKPRELIKSERQIPKAFFCLYLGITVLAILQMLLN